MNIYKWEDFNIDQPEENSSVIVQGYVSGELVTIDAHYKNGIFEAEMYQVNESCFETVNVQPIQWLKEIRVCK